jgi:single-strand DNA-binding protein
MSSDLNKVIIIGRLTKNPETRATQGGTSVCSFSIANNKSWKQGDEKKEQVSYFNCVSWEKGGEIIAQYMHKGDRICIEGRLQQRTWEKDGQKHSTVEIVVEGFQFLNSKSAASGSGQPESKQSSQTENPFSDDDVPIF